MVHAKKKDGTDIVDDFTMDKFINFDIPEIKFMLEEINEGIGDIKQLLVNTSTQDKTIETREVKMSDFDVIDIKKILSAAKRK